MSGALRRGREVLRRLGPRRALILLFLVAVLAGLLTTAGAVRTTDSAGAGTCVAREGRWHLKATEIRRTPTVAKVSFGATVCTDRRARITEVRPWLEGNVEGVGSAIGYDWRPVGVHVTRKTGTYVEIVGKAKSNICYGIKKVRACSLTVTETYRLRWWSVYGPYPPDRNPGIIGRYRWCSMTGCAKGDIIVRVA